MTKNIIILLFLAFSTLSFATTKEVIKLNVEGEKYYHENKYTEAKECFLEAFFLDKNYKKTTSNLGFISLKMGDLDEVIKWSEKTSDIKDNTETPEQKNIFLASISYDIGSFFQSKDIYLLALLDFTKANNTSPNEMYLKSIDKVSALQKDKAKDNKQSKLFIKKGDIQYSNQNFEDAINLYLKAIKFNEENLIIWNKLADSYFNNKEIYASEYISNTVISLANNNEIKAEAYYNLGRINEQKNIKSKAYLDYLQARKSNPLMKYQEAINNLVN